MPRTLTTKFPLEVYDHSFGRIGQCPSYSDQTLAEKDCLFPVCEDLDLNPRAVTNFQKLRKVYLTQIPNLIECMYRDCTLKIPHDLLFQQLIKRNMDFYVLTLTLDEMKGGTVFSGVFARKVRQEIGIENITFPGKIRHFQAIMTLPYLLVPFQRRLVIERPENER